MLAGRLLRFGGQRVVVLLDECLDVPFHREEAGALLVVPVKVNTGILLFFPVSADNVMIFQSGEEMFHVAFLHILNAKIIYY